MMKARSSQMRLIFVRHAEPDYSIDSLTPKGRFEAELLSRRLVKLNVKAFYVSPLGRAKDTALPTLKKLERTAEIRPWLAEFRGRFPDPVAGRSSIPWDLRLERWRHNPAMYDLDAWARDPLFAGGDVDEIWQETKAGIDALLAEHGYIRDGVMYRCADNQPDALVFFCHYGIATALVAHLTGMPVMPMWHGLCMLPSSVTTVVSEERDKGLIGWRCEHFGDISHLSVVDEKPSTAAMFHECYDGYDTTDPIHWIHPPVEKGPYFTGE